MSTHYAIEIYGDGCPIDGDVIELHAQSDGKAREITAQYAKKYRKSGGNVRVYCSFRRDGQRGYINPDGASLHSQSY